MTVAVIRRMVVFFLGVGLSWLTPAAQKVETPGHRETLKQIYLEVKELGPYPGEDFVRRDFFVGEDEDDTNKDTHVVVLIQTWDSREWLTLQVTDMQRSPSNPRLALARRTRSARYLLEAGEFRADRSEFGPRELQTLAPDILRAVLNKKRLLREGLVLRD